MTSLQKKLEEEYEEYATMLDEWVVGFGKYGTRSACDDWIKRHDQRILEAVKEEIESERKEIGYEDDQQNPDIVDESWADVYESKAEAWFAGWDKAVERVKEIITNAQDL